jgi:hypothetical protein
MWVQVLGYAATGLIVLAVTRTSLLRLRVLGAVGAIVFAVYGGLIGSPPVVITNVVIAAIHGWFLRKLIRPTELFSVLHVAPDSAYLAYFCRFHRDDISSFMPGWEFDPAGDHIAAFVLRDLVPAGLVMLAPHDDGTLEVTLDYAIPQYRDFKVGSYAFSAESGLFADLEQRRVWSRPWSGVHARYLRKMGFRPATRPDGSAVLELGLPG